MARPEASSKEAKEVINYWLECTKIDINKVEGYEDLIESIVAILKTFPKTPKPPSEEGGIAADPKPPSGPKPSNSSKGKGKAGSQEEKNPASDSQGPVADVSQDPPASGSQGPVA